MPEYEKTALEAERPSETAVPAKRKSLRARIDHRLKELGLLPNAPLETAFKVKGNHWLAVWSNNFKDRDGELFTAKAMEDYVGRVDKGVVNLPELWVWHAGAKTAIGSADWVATHGHFLMAAGQFYGGEAAKAAKVYYRKHAKETGISHGFTFPSDTFDGKYYHKFNSFEISLLPRGAEANWYTSLEGVKAMAVDEKKREYLKAVFGDEHAERILEDWDKRGKTLEVLEVEFKDFIQSDGADAEAVSTKALDEAEKTLRDFIPELVEGSGEAVSAALEAVKRVKALEAAHEKARAADAETIATLGKEIAALRADMQLRPRAASKAAETELDDSSEIGKALKADIEQQMTAKDSFWGTEVIQTP